MTYNTGKDNPFNQWCWENWTATYKRMKLDHYLTPHTEINSIWIKMLNVRPKTIKFLEEKIDSKLLDISLSNVFVNLIQRQRKQNKNK